MPFIPVYFVHLPSCSFNHPHLQCTAMRETWKEIGLDLAERDFLRIGQLDDREITTSLGKRLLMILSPFVFLQLTPTDLPMEPAEGTTIHWISLESLVGAVLPAMIPKVRSTGKWSSVSVDAASRLAPRHAAILKVLVRVLLGNMQFPAILLDVPDPEPSLQPQTVPASVSHPRTRDGALEKGIAVGSSSPRQGHQLKLWGLSLGMTLDLLANVAVPLASAETPSMPVLQLPFHPVCGKHARIDAVAPSLASVFPRFSYPDVDFWIWCVSRPLRRGAQLRMAYLQGLWEALPRGHPGLGSEHA